MLNFNLQAMKKPIHIIGIGGIGMSAIAKILHHMGYSVQGSDLSENHNVHRLHKIGIKVINSHHKSNITNISLVIKSSAIKDDNTEIIQAKSLNIPIISRAEILKEIIKFKTTIAVSGTHGKSTTTAMLGTIVAAAQLDPTIICGGIMNQYQDNVKIGNGNINIVEADESDGTFIALDKVGCIVTNIELDHIDFFHSYEDLIYKFNKFINSISSHGFAIINHDIIKICQIINYDQCLTFSTQSNDADIRASNIKYHNNNTTTFNVSTSEKFDKLNINNITINVSGEHNVSNALAAIGASLKLGAKPEAIKLGLSNYKGLQRRFSIIGKFNNAHVIDDYAHHPTEIVASIQSAQKLCSGTEKVIAIIQPHRYSRVRYFYNEYLKLPNYCNHMIFLPVFPAGEKCIEGYTSNNIVIKSKSKFKNQFIEHTENLNELTSLIEKLIDKGDKLLFMGAGNITNYAHYISDKDLSSEAIQL